MRSKKGDTSGKYISSRAPGIVPYLEFDGRNMVFALLFKLYVHVMYIHSCTYGSISVF